MMNNYENKTWYQKLRNMISRQGDDSFDEEPENLDEAVEYILNYLEDVEHDVILCRFKDQLDFKQTGEVTGLTKEQVRLVESKALRKLNRIDLILSKRYEE